MIKVSVIVPVYCVELYIERCAESLMQQTYPYTEFIFVNDGTPDGSMEILGRVLEKYPSREVIVIDKENEGQSLSRLAGVKASHGDYIIFLDSDDYIEADAVESIVSKAQESGADLIYYDFWKERGNKRKLDVERDYSIKHKELWMRRFYNDGAYGYLWSKCARRSLFEGVFFPKYNMHEDVVVSTQLVYNAASFAHLKKPLVHYRRDVSGSATRVSKAVRRSFMARNYLDFLSNGSKASSLVRNELLLRAAWVAYSLDRSIFTDYPFLKEDALALPVMFGRRVLVLQQIILKLWLKYR